MAHCSSKKSCNAGTVYPSKCGKKYNPDWHSPEESGTAEEQWILGTSLERAVRITMPGRECTKEGTTSVGVGVMRGGSGGAGHSESSNEPPEAL